MGGRRLSRLAAVAIVALSEDINPCLDPGALVLDNAYLVKCEGDVVCEPETASCVGVNTTGCAVRRCDETGIVGNLTGHEDVTTACARAEDVMDTLAESCCSDGSAICSDLEPTIVASSFDFVGISYVEAVRYTTVFEGAIRELTAIGSAQIDFAFYLEEDLTAFYYVLSDDPDETFNILSSADVTAIEQAILNEADTRDVSDFNEFRVLSVGEVVAYAATTEPTLAPTAKKLAFSTPSAAPTPIPFGYPTSEPPTPKPIQEPTTTTKLPTTREPTTVPTLAVVSASHNDSKKKSRVTAAIVAPIAFVAFAGLLLAGAVRKWSASRRAQDCLAEDDDYCERQYEVVSIGKHFASNEEVPPPPPPGSLRPTEGSTEVQDITYNPVIGASSRRRRRQTSSGRLALRPSSSARLTLSEPPAGAA